MRQFVALTLSVILSIPVSSQAMAQAAKPVTPAPAIDPNVPWIPSPTQVNPVPATDPLNPFPSPSFPTDPSFPNPTFPNDPVNPTNPTPGIPPFPPLPGGNGLPGGNPFPGGNNFPGGNFPGGNYGGGSYYCSNYSGGFGGAGGFGMGGYTNPPGTPAPRDMNNRPIIYPACNVPAEYDCPLFENRPHEALNQAIDALNQAMTTVPECQQQKASMDAVQQNSEHIRQSMIVLQAYMQQPESAYANLPALEQGITAAMTSANNLGQIFTNNSFVQSRCGQEVMSTGKVLLGLNDLLNNLAPYALMAVAINPAIGAAAKFAITGGAMATSAIGSMVKMIDQNTVDMTNPEHRRAVLKNTCHFSKIARKVRFMQLAQGGQIQKITSELGKHIEVKNAQLKAIAEQSPPLQEVITYTESTERMSGGIEFQIRKDNFELSALEAQMAEAKNDELYTCLIAQELVRRSVPRDQSGIGSSTGGFFPPGGSSGFGTTTLGIFPMSVILNLDEAIRVTQTEMNTQIASVKTLNDVSRRRISALETKVMEDDGAAIKMCADTARSWIGSLRQVLKLTGEIVNKERAQIETELAKNPEYMAWREQYRTVKAEEATVNRVAVVMKELAKDNSVIDRSELDQRMTLLKGALFGVRGSWSLGRSPILEWLEHTLRLQGNRISSFNQNIRQLQVAANQLVQQGTNANITYRIVLDEKDIADAAANVSAANLDAINLKNVPFGTRGHTLACQMIETAWLDWTSSFDHLGSTEFMCDMIDGHIDNKVEKRIVGFCRGEMTLSGQQTVLSKIQKTKELLVAKGRGNQPSYKDWALKISQKLQEMQCPTPPISAMN